MPIPFPFEFMVLFGILAIMLLIGVLLRARLSFFQKFLIPSCLIGGLLGLILVNTGLINLSVSNLETFSYHFFNTFNRKMVINEKEVLNIKLIMFFRLDL